MTLKPIPNLLIGSKFTYWCYEWFKCLNRFSISLNSVCLSVSELGGKGRPIPNPDISMNFSCVMSGSGVAGGHVCKMCSLRSLCTVSQPTASVAGRWPQAAATQTFRQHDQSHVCQGWIWSQICFWSKIWSFCFDRISLSVMRVRLGVKNMSDLHCIPGTVWKSELSPWVDVFRWLRLLTKYYYQLRPPPTPSTPPPPPP